MTWRAWAIGALCPLAGGRQVRTHADEYKDHRGIEKCLCQAGDDGGGEQPAAGGRQRLHQRFQITFRIVAAPRMQAGVFQLRGSVAQRRPEPHQPDDRAPDIVAVDQNAARCNVVESRQEVGYRRLTRATGSNERDHLPARQRGQTQAIPWPTCQKCFKGITAGQKSLLRQLDEMPGRD